MRFDAFVQEGASGQRAHRGKPHRFFLQRDKPSLLADHPAVRFAQIRVGAAGEKEQAEPPRRHFPQTAFQPHAHARAAALPLEHLIPRVGRGIAHQQIAVPLPDLPEPGQISVRCAETPAKRKSAQRRRPVVGDQKPLPQGQDRLPVRPRLVKRHWPRPADAGNTFPPRNRKEFQMQRAGRFLHPDPCLKDDLPLPRKSAVAADNLLSQAGFPAGMLLFQRIGEKQTVPLRGEKARLIVRSPRPFRVLVGNPDSPRHGIQAHSGFLSGDTDGFSVPSHGILPFLPALPFRKAGVFSLFRRNLL